MNSFSGTRLKHKTNHVKSQSITKYHFEFAIRDLFWFRLSIVFFFASEMATDEEQNVTNVESNFNVSNTDCDRTTWMRWVKASRELIKKHFVCCHKAIPYQIYVFVPIFSLLFCVSQQQMNAVGKHHTITSIRQRQASTVLFIYTWSSPQHTKKI